jgi:hypothetical protein
VSFSESTEAMALDQQMIIHFGRDVAGVEKMKNAYGYFVGKHSVCSSTLL